MNYMNDFRLELEKTIIAQCLVEGGFDQVANILSPKNFSKADSQGLYIDHQKVFAVFTQLYPLIPINLVTVTSKFNDVDRNNNLFVLTGYLSNLSSCANIKCHAFLLLEMCIRSEFINLLNNHKSRMEISNTTIPAHAAINEIMEAALDGDILDIIDKAPIYLKSRDGNLTNKVKEFNKNIDSKVHKIKEQAHLDCLFKNLMSLGNSNLDPNGKLAIHHLKDVIKLILTTGTVAKDKLNMILHLNIKR